MLFAQMKMKIQKIIIIKLGSIGDIVHTLPTLNALREKFPNAYISWIAKEEFSGLLLQHPSLDQVIPLSFTGSRIKVITGVFKIIRKIRKERYDVLLELQGDLRGGLISFLSGVPLRLGYCAGSSRVEKISTIFNNVKIREGKGHILESNLNFAKKLGAKPEKISFCLYAGEGEREYIGSFLEREGINNKKIVIVHPGTTWITKRWPVKSYAHLIDKIKAHFDDIEVIITYSPNEKELAEKLKGIAQYPPLISPPTTLRQLVALIERCIIFISSDTGPLHIAAGLGKKVIGLYGPIDPVRNGPYGTESIIIRKDINCSPCWRKKCTELTCMKSITVDEVFNAFRQIYP